MTHENKHTPKVTRQKNGCWQVSDGLNTGSGATIQDARLAFKDSKAESDAFRPVISQDAAYELLEALKALLPKGAKHYQKVSGIEQPYEKALKAIAKARGQ